MLYDIIGSFVQDARSAPAPAPVCQGPTQLLSDNITMFNRLKWTQKEFEMGGRLYPFKWALSFADVREVYGKEYGSQNLFETLEYFHGSRAVRVS